MHWSSEHIEFLRSVVPEIHETPIYILRASETAFGFSHSWLACTGALADLQSRPQLEALGLWSGRGAFIVVRDDFEAWSSRCQFGILLHELAHATERLTTPEALCDEAELCPLAARFLEIGEEALFAENGMEHGPALAREQHGPEFVRLAMHLLWRARNEMPLSAFDVQFLHADYAIGPERYEAVESSLAGELAMTRNLNLCHLREAPEAFSRLFQ